MAEATRRRVEEALDTLGYRRRSRATRRHLIDLVLPGLDTQWAAHLLSGAQAEAERRAYDLIVTSSHGSPLAAEDWVRRVVDRGTDAVVLAVSRLGEGMEVDLRRLGVPFVVINPHDARERSGPSVSASDWAGAREATDHLVSLGHTRIGIITGALDVLAHRDRLDGYRSALLGAGLPIDEDLVRHGDSLFGSGRALGAELLARPERPTAILTGSDEQANGVYAAAREAGLRIPEDLSVVGFDDVALAEWLHPALTTVHQPLAEMAQEATRMAIDLSLDGRACGHPVELGAHLVIRASTAPPQT